MEESNSYSQFAAFAALQRERDRERQKKQQQRAHTKASSDPRVQERIMNNSPGTIDLLRDSREVKQLAHEFGIHDQQGQMMNTRDKAEKDRVLQGIRNEFTRSGYQTGLTTRSPPDQINRGKNMFNTTANSLVESGSYGNSLQPGSVFYNRLRDATGTLNVQLNNVPTVTNFTNTMVEEI